MEKPLQQKKALVTGASSGIGKEMARQLATMGADLAIVARRVEKLQELKEELEANHQVSVQVVKADLSKPGAASEIFQTVMSEKKPISILINNAGIGDYAPFLNVNLESHRRTLQVNVVALTELTYLLLEEMIKIGTQSYIMNIASMASFVSLPNYALYSGTKRFVRHLSETLTYELKASNVHVICSCPGGTRTEFMEKAGQQMTGNEHAFMMSASDVAEESIDAMLSHQTIYVPGFLNRVLAFLPRLLPVEWQLWIAFKIMAKMAKSVHVV